MERRRDGRQRGISFLLGSGVDTFGQSSLGRIPLPFGAMSHKPQFPFSGVT